MRNVAILMFFIASAIGSARAQDGELRPLSEILQDEQSDVMVLYASERYAALFAVIVERTKENPSATDELIETWTSASDFLIQMSVGFVMTKQNVTQEKASETALNTIFEISKLYDKEMEAYYLRTGSSFNDKMQNDILTCTLVHRSLKEGIEG